MSISFSLTPKDISFPKLRQIIEAKLSDKLQIKNDIDNNHDSLYVDLISHFSHISISEQIDISQSNHIIDLFDDNDVDDEEISYIEIPEIEFKLKKPENKCLIPLIPRFPKSRKQEVLFNLSYNSEFHDLISCICSFMSPFKNLSSEKFKFKQFTASNIIISLNKSNNFFKFDFDLSFKISILQNFYMLPGLDNLNLINKLIELLYFPNPTNYQSQFNKINSPQTVSSFFL